MFRHMLSVLGLKPGSKAFGLVLKIDYVVLGCRTYAKCAQAAERIKLVTGKTVLPAELDLASFKSIRSFAEKFKAQFDTLDSLLLNAGVMAPPFSLTEDGLELTMGKSRGSKIPACENMSLTLFVM